MFKFKVGQIVKDSNNKLYIVEDTAIDKNGKLIYLLRKYHVEHFYEYETELENCDARYDIEA